MEVKTEKKST